MSFNRSGYYFVIFIQKETNAPHKRLLKDLRGQLQIPASTSWQRIRRICKVQKLGREARPLPFQQYHPLFFPENTAGDVRSKPGRALPRVGKYQMNKKPDLICKLRPIDTSAHFNGTGRIAVLYGCRASSATQPRPEGIPEQHKPKLILLGEHTLLPDLFDIQTHSSTDSDGHTRVPVWKTFRQRDT